MTEEKVDLPLQTENEKNYEVIALFWQITGEFLCIKYLYGWLLHKSETNGWLLVVTAGYG